MPWEISIINGTKDEPKPLGTREEVIGRFAKALPGALLQRPPVPPPEWLEKMPEILRAAMVRARLEADFEGGNFSMQFYCPDEPVIDCVNGEVRGDGDPIPALAALCVPNGWSVIDDSEKSMVDLTVKQSPNWDRFRNWRDKAIDSLKHDDRASE